MKSLRILGLVLSVLIPLASWAQMSPAQLAAWPSKPVKIVFPTGPGGANDAIVRVVAAKLETIWKQPVVIDYKPGAGIIIGTDFVAKSSPDGHTLGIAYGALWTTHILEKKLPYNTLKDITAITEIGNTPFGLYAHPSFEGNTVADVLAYAKKNQGKLDFTATPTAGASHLSGELMNIMAGIKMQHIPYKSTGASQVDVVGGRIPLWFSSIGEEMKQFVTTKQLKLIALTGPSKSTSFPGAPQISDTLPGFNVVGILGIISPSGVPKELRNKISADFNKAITSPEITERIIQLGMNPLASNPDQFNARILSEIERWTKVIQTAGIVLN